MSKTTTIFGDECPVLHEFYNSYSLVEFNGMPAVWHGDEQTVSVIHSAELPAPIRRDAAKMVAQIWEIRTKALQALYDWGKQHAGPVGSNI
jgi:hypothetical protein